MLDAFTVYAGLCSCQVLPLWHAAHQRGGLGAPITYAWAHRHCEGSA